MKGEDMAACEVPDKLTMVSYLSQFYEYFKKESAIIAAAKSKKDIITSWTKSNWDTVHMQEIHNQVHLLPEFNQCWMS